MHEIQAIAQLPSVAAIYAMYGGDTRRYVAYVGKGDVLRRRINQHLLLRNSSVSTGTTATALIPDHVREVVWWEHARFVESVVLQAAELVAFDVLEPALRSRGGIGAHAAALALKTKPLEEK